MWLVYKAMELIGQLRADLDNLAYRVGVLAGNSGGGGGGSTLVFSTGAGSPETNVIGSPGDTYWDLTNDFYFVKVTGVATNTGWRIH